METTLITALVKTQLNTLNTGSIADEDSIAFYQSLLGNINSLSPIKSFTIGINTGKSQGETHSNITIITFEHLPKNPHLRNDILQQVYYSSDEYPEIKFLRDQDILIISFDF